MIVKVNKKDMPWAPSPAFSYCRKLIAEGYPEDTRLEIYGEHEYFDYAIPNIGIGAGLTIKEEPHLHIAKYSPPSFIKDERRPPGPLSGDV